MARIRIIPVLLLSGRGVVKTEKFAAPSYIGDPLNIVRIFNEKEIDELVVLDINATKSGYSPQLQILREIASECFMPLCYGGGITDLDQIDALFSLGIEKVALTSAALRQPQLIESAARKFGSQAIVVNIDARKDFLGRYRVYGEGATNRTSHEPCAFAKEMEAAGAGEIIISSVDRDGTMSGYDLKLIESVSSAVRIPTVALGGAGSVADLARAVDLAGASAVAAGSLFIFHGPHRAVLINVPSYERFNEALEDYSLQRLG